MSLSIPTSFHLIPKLVQLRPATKRAGVTEHSRLTSPNPGARGQVPNRWLIFQTIPQTLLSEALPTHQPAQRPPRGWGQRGVTPRELPRDVTGCRRPPGPGGAGRPPASLREVLAVLSVGSAAWRGRALGEKWAVTNGGAFPARRTDPEDSEGRLGSCE